MARVGADLTNVKAFENIPDGIQTIRLHVCKPTISRETKNPMIENTWKVEGGEYDGREIRYDNVVLSGKSKEGNPIVPFTLVSLLEALEAPWRCGNCGVEGARDFLRGKGPEDDGLVKGQIYCPDCSQPVNIEFDTDDLEGKRCLGDIDHRKAKGSDKEYNFVKKYGKLN